MTQSLRRVRSTLRMRPIEMVWVSIPVLLPALVMLRSRMSTIDLAYQIRAGNGILDSGSIPRHNSYTFTAAGARWVDQQWGAQVILAAVHRVGSWSAIFVLAALLVSLAAWLLYLACRAEGAGYRTASLLTVAGFVVAWPSLAMRPQLLAVPLFTCALWLLAGRERHPGRLWALPLVAVACTQLHGAFVLIPALVGLGWLEDWHAGSSRTRRLAVLTVLTGLATLMSPLGIVAWTNAVALSSNDLIRSAVTEWQPASLDNLSGWLVILSGMAVAVLWARRATVVAWVPLLRLGIFFLLAMLAGRACLWWAFVAAVEVAALMASTSAVVPERTERPHESMVPAVAIIGVLVGVILAYLPVWGGTFAEDRRFVAPTALSDAVTRQLPPGSRLLVEQSWGSWFEYEVPTMPVFVDSLFEVVPEPIWRDYVDIRFARADWREILGRWHVDAIVASKDRWDVLPHLRSDPDWRVAFEDDEGVLFVRRSTATP